MPRACYDITVTAQSNWADSYWATTISCGDIQLCYEHGWYNTRRGALRASRRACRRHAEGKSLFKTLVTSSAERYCIDA